MFFSSILNCALMAIPALGGSLAAPSISVTNTPPTQIVTSLSTHPSSPSIMTSSLFPSPGTHAGLRAHRHFHKNLTLDCSPNTYNGTSATNITLLNSTCNISHPQPWEATKDNNTRSISALQVQPVKTPRTHSLFPKVTPQTLASIPVTQTVNSQSTPGPRKQYLYLPAVDFGGNPHNPIAWAPQPTQDYLFTPSGGHRDLSKPHQFLKLNIEYGNRSGVDLELSDGVANIVCQSDEWQIQTKDPAHFDVAKRHWDQNSVLVTSTLCNSGASRRILQVKSLSFLEPDTIIAHGQEGLLGLGPPATKLSVNSGFHQPYPEQVPQGRNPSYSSPQFQWKRAGGITSVVERRGWDDFGSDISNVWGSATSYVDKGWETATSDAAVAVNTVTADAASEWHKATSAGESMYGHLTSLGKSLENKITAWAASNHTMEMTASVQYPNATPTGVSPFDRPGERWTPPGGIDGINVWDLGIQMKGAINIGLGFSVDISALDSNTDKFFEGYIDVEGTDWDLDIPLGLDLKKAEAPIPIPQIELTPPVDLCPELGCFALENVFELGSDLEMLSNITLQVDATGKIETGINLGYSYVHWHWDSDSSKNTAEAKESHRDKWFRLSEGEASFEGDVGVDFTQFNGIKLDRVKDANVNISFIDGLSIGAKVSTGTEGNTNENSRRDISLREHPKDILEREILKRDTCASSGGVDVELHLDEALIVNAGAGLLGYAPTLWGTEVPLYTTCIPGAGHASSATPTAFSKKPHTKWRTESTKRPSSRTASLTLGSTSTGAKPTKTSGGEGSSGAGSSDGDSGHGGRHHHLLGGIS